MDYGGLLEARVTDAVCLTQYEIPVTLIVKKGSTNSKVFRKMKHFMDQYFMEPDLIEKSEEEEDHELSDDKISDQFVPVEDGE